jgi:hypothetical protein
MNPLEPSDPEIEADEDEDEIPFEELIWLILTLNRYLKR